MGVIMHNNIPYGGGSSIEPNPQESATEQLETLGIDGDVYEVTDANAIHTSDVGVANGIAELDANGFVPSSQLPSYVDDVLEYASRSAFPATGETGKIYVALDTNLTYRWGGSDYVEISPSLALGETSSTAYRGDRGKIAYEHSQSDHSGIKPAFTEAATRANIASGETIATLLGKIKKFFSDLKDLAFIGKDGTSSTKYLRGDGTWQNFPTIPTVNNGTLTIQKNGTNVATFTANQSANATANIECATPSDVEGSNVVTGNPITITDAAGIKAEKIEIGFEPKQAGSGTPSPSNIRPITGYTSLSADRCGKQLFDKDATDTSKGYVANYFLTVDGELTSNSSYCISEYIRIPEAEYISFGGGYHGWEPSVCFYDINKNFISGVKWNARNSFAATRPSNAAFVRVSYNTANVSQLQVEEGVASTYEPFKGDSVLVEFNQTLYGGKLTILQDGSADVYCDTGIIDDMGTSADIDWENAAGLIAQGTFPFTITGADYINQVWLSEAYNIKYQSNWNMNNGEIIVVKTSGGSVGARLQNTSYNTLAGLKASLAGQKLVYALATPFTLHLSPVEALTLLQGINNVWTDGTTLSLTYQPDNAIGQAKGTAQELVDSASTWKLFAESPNANIALPTNCKELYICVIYVTGSTSAIMYDFHILPDTLTKATSYFRHGDYYTPDYFCRCEIRIRKTSNVYDTRVECLYMNNTTDRSANTTVKVYYR